MNTTFESVRNPAYLCAQTSPISFGLYMKIKDWERLVELAGNSPITAQEIERMSLTTITSVNKNEIVKEWKEQLMILFPIVEQFHMVPFHDRWIQSQFKDEENIKKDWAESHGGRIASLIVQQTMASLETVLVLVFA